MRLRSLLAMFSLQSFLLAVFAAVAAKASNEWHLLITAVLTLLLKTWFLPWFLLRTAKRAKAVQRLQSYLRPATIMLLGGIMVLGAFYMTRSVVLPSNPEYLVVAASVAMVMLGLLMLVSRRGMYGQIVGFLLMENGIFTFGLSLTGGMPLLVELGIFFDVAIGAILMAALSYRVQVENKTVATHTLTELID
jgi:hydrogenase-4 component E